MIKNILIICLLLTAALVQAQNSRLAAQYYSDGEYEKAASTFKQLYEKDNNAYYFKQYINCLVQLQQYDRGISALKQEIKKNPKNAELYVTYGNLLDRENKPQEADAQYSLAIKRIPNQSSGIKRLASTFINIDKFDYAIQVYERGTQLVGGKYPFSYNLGDLYLRKGDYPAMITNYLQSILVEPARYKSVQRIFQSRLPKDKYGDLQAELYAFIQEQPDDNVPYIELLIWSFIQQKDYKNAARQVKALDRRLAENGSRVYRLARMAANGGDYDAAIDAYNYLIEREGQTDFYVSAKQEALRTLRKKITEKQDYTSADLEQLKQMYLAFLDEFGRNSSTAGMVAELAELEAFYIKNTDEAIRLLKELLTYQGVDKNTLANAKLSLADLYLITGDRWEATLLYSQVDKAHTNDALGHEARFRNAKLSYYFGDFEWAQAQFKVLKASTSKLIANDALDLSVFILDNLGLDTTAVSLQLFAEADLLAFQNRYDEAFQKMDSLLVRFPEHSLQDDVFYTKAKAYNKLRQYEQAEVMYKKVIDQFPEDIRADNSLYELAALYENVLDRKEEAKALYEKLFLDYSGSTFAVDARKRYRVLRGDNI